MPAAPTPRALLYSDRRAGTLSTTSLGWAEGRSAAVSEDFATKLKITAAALGCNTQKELCARFRAINPDTPFDPTRAYKWVQGRSRPRDWRLYDDWATVLDLGKSGQFLRNCALSEFIELVGERYDLPPAMLRSLGGLEADDTPAPPAPAAAGSPHAYLAGAYTAYSPAWSPAAQGKIVRGDLTIIPDGAGGHDIRYVEALVGGSLDIGGKLARAGRSLVAALGGGDIDSPIFFCISDPAPPALLLLGVISGAVVHDAEARPTASRVICVRNRTTSPHPASHGAYLESERDVLAADLERIGYDPSHTSELAGLILSFILEQSGQAVVDAPQAMIGALTRAFYWACLES